MSIVVDAIVGSGYKSTSRRNDPLDEKLEELKMTTTANATVAKPTNYSDAQVAIITAAIIANGNVADKSVAEALVSNPEMNVDGEPRKVRSLVAKMRRMVDANEDFSYAKVEPTTKDGKAIAKKSDLVAEIVALSRLTAAKLDGLDKAPKLALETLRDAFKDAA